MRLHIREKLLLSFAFLLIFLGIISIISYRTIEVNTKSQVKDLRLLTLQLASQQVQNFQANIELELQGIAREIKASQTGGSDWQAVTQITQHTIKQNPFLYRISILSPSGKLLLEADNYTVTDDPNLDYEIPTQPFRMALEHKTGISKVYRLENSNTSQVDIFTPVINSSGKVISVIKGQIRLDHLWNIIAQAQIGQTGISYVVDEEGRLIAHPDEQLLALNPVYSNRQIISDLIKSDKNQISTDYLYKDHQNQLVVGNSYKIPGINWIVVVEQSHSEAYSQIQKYRRTFISAFLISLAILLLVSILISRQLSGPIKKLQQGADSLSRGDLDQTVDIKTGDELQDLAGAFNLMASQLKHTFTQLHEKVSQLQEQKHRLDQSAKLLLRRDLDLRETNEDLEQQKEAFQAERNKMSIVLSGISDAVIAVDQNRWVVIFNQAATQLTGYSSTQAIGQPIDKLLKIFNKHQDEIPIDEYCPLRKDKYEGVTYSNDEVSIIGRQQKYTIAKIISGHIKEGYSANLGCIITLHDLTHEKELETMKLDFVSMAAHELRTPLTTVRGYISFLQKQQTANKLSEREQEFVNKASLSAQRLNKLIDNLLVVSKIEQGKVSINLQPVDLLGLLDKMMKEYIGLAKIKGLELNWQPPQKPLPEVLADQIAVEEVISNLVGNAFNYTQRGSVTVKIWQEQDQIITMVEDTGEGIPQEAIPRLFTKFFRVKGDLESGSKGTGLGLYISKRIIDSMHGKIWVESVVNHGSKFYFSLPVAKEQNP